MSEVRIEGLNKLENVTIGDNSFGGDGSLYLRNCPLLKEVRIGYSSFTGYRYSYVENLESLELLQYGDVEDISKNFWNLYYASFESD